MDGVMVLMGEARGAGCTIQAVGDRLVIRGPRKAEPIVRLLLVLKADVIRALRTVEAVVVGRIGPARLWPWPGTPIPLASDFPHDAGDDTHDDDPRINTGWTRRRWIDRLRQLAAACEALHPDRAAELRGLADELGTIAVAPYSAEVVDSLSTG